MFRRMPCMLNHIAVRFHTRPERTPRPPGPNSTRGQVRVGRVIGLAGILAVAGLANLLPLRIGAIPARDSAAGPVPAHAQDSESGVAGTNCRLLEAVDLDGDCPPIIGPQRDDPWLPTVELPQPDDDLGDCNVIAVTISHIRFIPMCPTDHAPYSQPILGFEGATRPALHLPAPDPEPSYSGPYDAVPILMCFQRDLVPQKLYITHREHEDRYIGSARASVYCCEECR